MNKNEFLSNRNCYVFGWCYGKLASIAPGLSTPGMYSNACSFPARGFSDLNTRVISTMIIPADVQLEIGNALSEVNVDDLKASRADDYGQSSFALGYYHALANRELYKPAN